MSLFIGQDHLFVMHLYLVAHTQGRSRTKAISPKFDQLVERMSKLGHTLGNGQ